MSEVTRRTAIITVLTAAAGLCVSADTGPAEGDNLRMWRDHRHRHFSMYRDVHGKYWILRLNDPSKWYQDHDWWTVEPAAFEKSAGTISYGFICDDEGSRKLLRTWTNCVDQYVAGTVQIRVGRKVSSK